MGQQKRFVFAILAWSFVSHHLLESEMQKLQSFLALVVGCFFFSSTRQKKWQGLVLKRKVVTVCVTPPNNIFSPILLLVLSPVVGERPKATESVLGGDLVGHTSVRGCIPGA